MPLRVAELDTLFTATIDDFEAKTRKVEKKQAEIDGSRTEAEIVADVAAAMRHLDGLQADLESIATTETEAVIGTDFYQNLRDIEEVRAELEEIHLSQTEPQIDPDVYEARRTLDDINDELDEIDDLEVRPKVDADVSRARSALGNFRDEAADSGREAAASFSGEFDDIGDFAQEALAGLGAAGGPVGLAAGIAGGVVAGYFVNDFMESAEELEELTGEIFDALADDGAASFARMSEEARQAFIQTRADALLAEHGVDDIAGAAEALGVSADIALAAMAGDTEALAEVSAAYESKVADIGDQWGYSSEVGTGKIRALDDATRILSDETGALDDATREANKRQDLMGQTMDEVTGKAEVEEQAARDLAAEINAIPDDAYTDIHVNTDGAFDRIRALNSTLNAVNGRTVTAHAASAMYGQGAYAGGGAVYGPGTGTSDSILARVSNGEHVWTAAEVDAIGGHSEVERMRQLALAGDLPEFADGGAVLVGGSRTAAQVTPAPRVSVSAPSLNGVHVVLEVDGRSVTGVMREVARGELRDAALQGPVEVSL